MYKKLSLPILSAIVVVFVILSIFKANTANAEFTATIHPAATFASLGTAFTYQGHLTDGGQPANGSYDFIFDLYDSATTGSLVDSITLEDQAVIDGMFTVVLDYGDMFDGTALWLEIRVRPGESLDAYTTLEPRQGLSATPYASYATKAGSIPWSGIDQIPTGFADDVDNDVLAGLACIDEQVPEWNGNTWVCGLDDEGAGDVTGVYAGLGLTGGGLTGTVTLTVGAGTGLTASDNAIALSTGYQLPQGCSNGYVAKWNDTSWICSPDQTTGSNVWSITGNAGTTAGTNFLGTTDDEPLELHVNSLRAFLLEPNAASPNIIAGYSGNSVGTGVEGASVAGGGRDVAINQVDGDYSTVGGGAGNTAGGYAATLGGGEGNESNGSYSTVAGGAENIASNPYTSVGGGQQNNAAGDYATVGGGHGNLITDTSGTIAGGGFNTVYADYATVGGGLYNSVAGAYGTIAGGGSTDLGNPTTTNNQVLDDYGTVSGGGGNVAGNIDGDSTNSQYATVGGGRNNTASNIYATTGGGTSNTASGYGATIGGGVSNSSTNNYAVVAGGTGNTASGDNATVSGGASNTASQTSATVGGGNSNTVAAPNGTIPGGAQNYISGEYAAISGGLSNTISADHAALGGGQGNLITATYGTIAGGVTNTIFADYAAIGGGEYNYVTGAYGTIAGGGPADLGNPTTTNNQVLDDYGTVSGGGGNIAGSVDVDSTNAQFTTVGGGQGNTAGATYATVGGGTSNTASGYGAAIGGGVSNSSANNYAVVAGGTGNTASGTNAVVSGGTSNTANQTSATVGGGNSNTVAAPYGTIPGGAQNYVSGLYGFAAGYQARAEHQGSFVWSDSQGEAFSSTAPDQFLINASGGVGIGTSNATPTRTLSVGGNAAVLGDGRLLARSVFTSTNEFYRKGLQKASAIDAAGNYIYVTASATNTLTIIDVSDPDYPKPITYTTSSLHNPVDVQVEGGLAFIASELNNSLVIIDVSDPAKRLKSIGSSDRLLAKPQAVHVVGNRVYVASFGDIDIGVDDGLVIFDVSDPAEPLNLGFTDTNLDGPTDVFVAGDHAYVTSQNNDSLAIFDVSEPDNILADGAFSDPTLLAGPRAVHVKGSYAYVLAENADRLVILDINNPAQITLVDSITTTLTHPRSLFLSGDYAYVAYAGAPTTAEDCGLAVFDISDLSDIQVLSVMDMSDSLPEPEKPVAIRGNGRHIYVANEAHDSVTIYDINHLAAPAVTAGNVQADYLEANVNARVNHNLSVGDGLNVGPGGALIEGQLSVAGPDNNYILGNLSLGAAGIVYSDSEKTQIMYPTQQLDVHGDARFRINDNHSLIMSSPPVKGAFLDFTTNNFGAYYTPTARIEFSVPDPFTGTTHTTEVKILTQSASDTYARGRMTIGEEISFHNVDPGEPDPDLNLRTTITLTQSGDVLPGVDATYTFGDSDHRWQAVYAVNGTIQTSDIRWKENITELPYGLEQVKQLQPIAFTWVDGAPQDVHYGLVAQEVAEVLPELVTRDDSPDAPLGMNYGELVPVLIRAVQEQQVEIDTQAEQIASLEARLSALEGSHGDTGSENAARNPLSWIGALGLVIGAVGIALRKW